MSRHVRPLVACTLAGALLTGACSQDGPAKQAAPRPSASAAPSTSDADAAPTAPTGDATSTGQPAFAPDALRRGDTREFPLAVGASRAVGTEWEVEVVGYDPDATAEVEDFNAGNEPPPEGEVFALARIRATYVGPDASANAFLDLEWALVDDAGGEHTDADCGVLPDDLASQSGVPPGGTVEGTICASVPRALLGQVVLYLRPLLGDAATHVWWSAPRDGAGRVLAG